MADNNADNAWQLTAATLVALQSMPGLVLLYGGLAKKKWAVNSSLMAVYAFAVTLICWVGWGYRMSFGDRLTDFLGKPAPALDDGFLMGQAFLGSFPAATMVWFQFVFAAIAAVVVGGAVVGRMRFAAWMAVVPLWHTVSYTVGAYSVWNGEGWLAKMGVIDFAGGFVIHLSSGVAGYTAAFWVGPRSDSDRKRFPPNSIVMTLAGAGLLWMGWTGFNGGAPYAATAIASLAVINTHVCAAASLLTWLLLDMTLSGKPSAAGAVNGVISGLVCITPAAGLVQCWAAVLIGLISGSLPWYTLHRVALLRRVDDPFAGFHTHAVAGALGGVLVGVLAEPELCRKFYGEAAGGGGKYVGLAYALGGSRQTSAGVRQVGWQIVGVVFVVCLNVAVMTVICLVVRVFVGLRMSEEEMEMEMEMEMGDEEVHGEVAYGIDDQSRFLHAKLNSIYDADEAAISKTPTYQMHRV